MIRDFKINIIFCYEFSNVGESSYPFLAKAEGWQFILDSKRGFLNETISV